MPPNQIPNQPQFTQQNQYDFILNNEQNQPKKSFNLFNGGSKVQRIFLFAGAGTLMLIVVMLAYSMLSSGDKSQSERLLSIAQQQTEIIRVTGLAKNKARSTATQSLASTTSITIQSSKNDITELLKKSRVKVNDKIFNSAIDPRTDETLESASLNNRYDQVFTEIVTAELKSYQLKLKEAFDNTSSKAQKEALEKSYNSVSTLLK
ncbi:hypothetical protein KDA11_04240 [Candidatus Saccharibacteria bacterium]|nr:hypothetical protein [Candidatus Saccharibacteria bacterium]